MQWKPFLHENFEYQYAIAENLMNLVTDDTLNWKPATGQNWMTVGQLLRHMTDACGLCVKGFVTGDWGMPENGGELPAEDMLPAADKLPTVGSVAEAKRLLAEDKALAFAMLNRCSEEELESKPTSAPWNPMEYNNLGRRLLEMATHLQQHKGQLFYYLKLEGLPVNTGHLWG